MSKQRLFGFLVLSATLTGCGGPETAQVDPPAATVETRRSEEDIAADTLHEMLEVASRGDWQSYVDSHYGEQHKFRSPADRDALVRRFEQKWGEKLVEGLSRAADLPVQITGDQAVFADGDDAVFVLHRSEDGDWKFHL